ncbi:MmgE/PrpD family protein [Cereibacter sphaeroides]|nr:MmgE/PrpD family protein [Cereibacter sphaeroides]
MTEPLLAPLARFAAQRRGPAPGQDPRLDERLEATLVDYAGALVAGLGHPLAAPYLRALGPQAGEAGPAWIAGQTARAPVEAAAMTNAALAHLWEVDDAHRLSTSHPGIVVLPTVFALACTMPGLQAADLRDAIVAGYEAVLRVGAFLGPEHYAVNHTTATAGAFGAAAAAGRLLGFDADRMLWALGHAGTQAAGLWQFLDDGAGAAKMLHAGLAARAGLTAARLAQAGIPGAPHVLEGPRGALRSWQITGGDPSLLLPAGEERIHDVTIKAWPTCGQMHSALDCARALTQRPDWPGAEAIRAVEVEVPSAARAIAGNRDPQTLAEAKFSTSFCIAALLSGFPPDFRGCMPALLTRPEPRAMETKVSLSSPPAFDARFPRERPARVNVTLADGRILTEERAFRSGDPEAPWDRPALAGRLVDVLALAPDHPAEPEALIRWARRLASAEGPAPDADALAALIPLSRPEIPAA